IELLIALIMVGILGTALIKTMTNIQRFTGAQAARLESQESMRAATFYVSAVLHEIDANENDLITAGTSTVRYRAPRWMGLACSGLTVSGTNVQATVKRSQLWGTRNPSPSQDSLFVFNEVTTAQRADDVWLTAKMVDTTAQNCGDGSAGLRLTFTLD